MTRRELFRRRIAPAIFIIGMAAIIQHTCAGAQRHHATVELDLGDARATTRAVDAELRAIGAPPEAEALAMFKRRAMPGSAIGPCKFDITMPDDTAELVIDVTLGDPGVHRRVTRTIYANTDGEAITIPLGASLAQP